MAFPEIISFYIENSPQQLEVEKLIASCKKYNLDYSIESVEDFGSDELNRAFKPFFIVKKLQELKKPLLWVEPTGVIVKKPCWQDAFGADVALRLDPVLSATLYVRPSVLGLLKTWIKEIHKQLTDLDEPFNEEGALYEALQKLPPNLEIAPLPLVYVKSMRFPMDEISAPDPVISHY